MIEYSSGDMFDTEADVRVNTVNCVGVMGAGVALAFKRRYPAMFKDYGAKCRRGEIRPGKIDVWRTLSGEWVINFPTKVHWREHSRYEYIDAGLNDLRTYLQAHTHITVALPALGCGHGGLDWTRVKPMIEDKLGDLDVNLVVFEPASSRNAGQAELQRDLMESHFREVDLVEVGFELPATKAMSSNSPLPPIALISGNAALMSAHWIGLIPSKAPGEREWIALSAVSKAMAERGKPATIALIHTARATENIAKLFLERGNGVVLILPFGPLSRSHIAGFSRGFPNANFAIVSLAKPQAAWSAAGFSRSLSLLCAGAGSILLTDPKPRSLSTSVLRDCASRRVFYLAYEFIAEELRLMARSLGARPVGRRAVTGEPNLTPLFDVASRTESLGGEQVVLL